MNPQALGRESTEDEPVEQLEEEIGRAEENALQLADTNASLGGKLRFRPTRQRRKGAPRSRRSVYRQVDRTAQLEAALDDINSRIVDLAFDNAMLADRKEREHAVDRVRLLHVAGVTAAFVLTIPVLLFGLGGSPLTVAVSVWCASVGGLGALIYVLEQRIAPRHPSLVLNTPPDSHKRQLGPQKK